eukprot:2943355-Rhodomonas_salina.2
MEKRGKRREERGERRGGEGGEKVGRSSWTSAVLRMAVSAHCSRRFRARTTVQLVCEQLARTTVVGA